MNVGFAGLGRMGLAMARNVLHAGFPLTVYNRTSGRAEALVEEGARAVERPDHLGACDLVVTMVSDAAAARAVLVEGGLLDALLPGSIVIEMSTIEPGRSASRRPASTRTERAAAASETMVTTTSQAASPAGASTARAPSSTRACVRPGLRL